MVIEDDIKALRAALEAKFVIPFPEETHLKPLGRVLDRLEEAFKTEFELRQELGARHVDKLKLQCEKKILAQAFDKIAVIGCEALEKIT